ncbi:MAG: cysteine desulfurase [Clostridia bacterium]|nr:cysteine desulfurase [Clostridia bacterium]
MKPAVYADYAATAPLRESAREAMRPWLEREFGNPSAADTYSQLPRHAVREARETIARILGARTDEIYFTSGGTESDNWAVKGRALACHGGRPGHLIISAIEHHAVLEPCAFLERLGWKVTRLCPDREGIIRPETVGAALRPDTALVSVMAANNEIGTVQDIPALAKAAGEAGVAFHTDAVQAMGHIPLRVDPAPVCLLSASAHKFGGPKGIGFLYVRHGTALEPLHHGGGQERGMRAGTENVAGIVGMAAALSESVSEMEHEQVRLEELRERLILSLREAGLDFRINGGAWHLPGSLSLSFAGQDGRMLVYLLDRKGIAVAAGSACNSREIAVSHVLSATGVPDRYIKGTVRITLGRESSGEDVDRIASEIVGLVR